MLGDPSADSPRCAGWCSVPGRSTTTWPATSCASRPSSVAVGRLEQLYPFPVEPDAELVRSFPQLEEVVWAQEEPQNMGAWRAIRHRLEESLPNGVRLRFVGRPWRASPTEGYPTAHLKEQDRIVREALTRLAAAAAALLLRDELGREDRPVIAPLAEDRPAVLLRGMRRQTSQAVSARPTVPVRREDEAGHRGGLALRPVVAVAAVTVVTVTWPPWSSWP